MQVYVNLEIKKDNGSISNQRTTITLNDIKDLREEVIKDFSLGFTWCELISYNVVARLDGSCDTIDKQYYQKTPCKVIARTEKYEFIDGVPFLVKSTEPIVFENI